MRFPLQKQPGSFTFNLEFEEHEARVFAGLSLMEYDQLPGSPIWRTEQQQYSKCEILVLHRLNRQMRAIQEQVASKKRR